MTEVIDNEVTAAEERMMALPVRDFPDLLRQFGFDSQQVWDWATEHAEVWLTQGEGVGTVPTMIAAAVVVGAEYGRSRAFEEAFGNR